MSDSTKPVRPAGKVHSGLGLILFRIGTGARHLSWNVSKKNDRYVYLGRPPEISPNDGLNPCE